MSEELDFTPDLYNLIDEDGVEQTFEMLDAMEVDGERYYALVPYYENEDDLANDDGELVILKSQMEDDEEALVSIDNEEEFNKIGQMFLERLETMFEDDCDCDDDDCDCHQ